MPRSIVRATATVSLFLTAACTQPAAHVDMKGQNVYGRASTQVAFFSGSSNQFQYTAQPSEPVKLSTDEYASVAPIAINDLNTPPQPQAQKPQVVASNVNSNPGTLSPSAGSIKDQQASSNIQKINPWTGRPRQEFVSDDGATKIVTKPVKLSSDQQAPSDNFIWPVSNSKVISGFGPKGGGKANDGINIAAGEGEPVWAAADGEVVYSGNDLQGYGNMVLVKHAGDKSTSYAHLSRATVDKYERVKQGDIIGYVGSTGNVKEPQLHFSVREGKDAIDPHKYLSRSVAGL